jgi:hypothetical protein
VKKAAGGILQVGCYGLLIATAITALWAMTQHLDKPLLGPHSFRQTQTAISAYYMAEDPSMFLDYITPVLGPPWQIPMELPIYQWIVARWHHLTDMALDPSGKLISILAWFACLAPIVAIGRSLGLPRQVIALTLTIALASPLYLFWGAAFLIETTGLFLALCLIACALRVRESCSWQWLLLALLVGSLAASVKATTWAVAAGTGLLLVLFARGLPRLADGKPITLSLLALLLPLLPGKIWLASGDSLKQANPFAREIILASSDKQAAWNFGTWEQKLDPNFWQVIFRHVTDQLLVPLPLLGFIFLPVVIIAGAVLAPRRIPLILIFLAGFASGPIVFTNLYFEHSYYWCANGIWLLLAVGVALAGIWQYRPQSSWPKLAAIGLTSVITISGFVTWSQRYLPILQSLPTQEALAEAWTRPVQRIVPPSRTLLIVGNDWNPNSLYYAQRKGIAFPSAKWIPFPGPQIEESLALFNQDEALGAIVVNPRLIEGPQNQEFWNAFLQERGFSISGTSTAFGIIFPTLDLKFGELD